MALSRLVQTATREFWQETAAASFAAGTTTTLQTLIERATIMFGGLHKVHGRITLSSVTGTPVVTAAATYTGDGRLQVALTNSGAGSQAAWTLDLKVIDAVNGGDTLPLFEVVTEANPAAPATNRLYVDGTLGDDGNSGTGSYDTAWKTCDKLVRELSIQDALFPNASVTYVHMRGAFEAADHLILSALMQSRGRIVIGHDFADSTVTQTGLVVTVDDQIAPAGVPVHDLTVIEVSGITFTAADEGRHMRFNDGAGGHVATAQIVSVADGTHAWISWRFGAGGVNPENAAWVVGGSTIQVHIFESAAVIAGSIHLTASGRTSQGATAPLAGNALSLFNLRTYSPVTMVGGQSICLWVDARNGAGTAQNITTYDSTTTVLGGWTANNFDPADLFEYGFADASSPCFAIGCRANTVVAVGGSVEIHGRFVQDVQLNGLSLAYVSNARSFQGSSSMSSQAVNCIGSAATTTTSPPFTATSGGRLRTERCVAVGTAAAGLATGFWVALTGGHLDVVNCSGVNDGTGGANLYGVFIDTDGSVSIDGDSCAAIDGKHGRLWNPGGKLRTTSAATVGAGVVAGPDIYIGPGASLHLGGDYIKSAVNTGASPVLVAVNPLSITQLAGAAFTLFTPPGAPGDWPTSYGVTGAIDMTGNVRARLGILTGGAGATTGVACTLHNNAQLIHEGVGLSGVTPMQLGAAALGAWPGAITSDLAAGVPENCWLFLV